MMVFGDRNEVIRVGPNPKGTAALLEDRYKQVLCLLALMPCAGRPALDIAPGLELLSTHNLDLSQPLFYCVCWYMCMVLYVCVTHMRVCIHTFRGWKMSGVFITSCLISLK